MYAIKQWLIHVFLYEWLSMLFPNSVRYNFLTESQILLISLALIAYAAVWLSFLIPIADYVLQVLTELDDYFTKEYGRTYKKFRFVIIIILFNTYFLIVNIFFMDFSNLYWHIFELLSGLS